jgi:hypothetical protein
MSLSKKLLTASVFIFLLAQCASSDVKMKQKSKNSGFAGLGASESEEVVFLTADKMKSVTTSRFTGGVVGFFAGKGPRTKTNIVRLDKELIWDVDDEEKEYKETTFAEMRAQMEEARAKMKSMEQPETKEEASDTKINLKWDVKKTGEEKTINGFPCDHVILTLTVEEENLTTHEKRDLSYFTMDQWLNAGQDKARAEMEEFHLKMAKAMGISEGASDFLAALMAQYGDYLKQLKEKAKDLAGLPILSTITIETIGGGQGEQQEMKEEEKPKIELPGGFGGLFGKKKDKEKEAKSEEKKGEGKTAEEGKARRTTIFSVTTEVTEVGTPSINPIEFDIPAGYERKD